MASFGMNRGILEAGLQTKYNELLEKRIKQLEVALSEAKAKNEEDDEEEKKKKDDADDKTKSRYVIALREWDESSASYKDRNISEDALKKAEHKDVAYVFRRVVYDTYKGEKRAYSEVEIEDAGLVQLLKDNIDNKYPGVNLDGKKIYMQAPFPAIIHNWEKLRERAKQDPDSQLSKDLSHLLGRIETAEELEDYFKTREANASANVTTFETMWTVFAPKTLIVVKPYMGHLQLLQVHGSPIPSRWMPTNQITRLWLEAWGWDWNGKKMVKVFYDLKIKRFRGTKQINELDYYPLSYHSDPGLLRSQIVGRSKSFLRMTRFVKPGAGQSFSYEGNAFVTRRKVVSVNKEDDEDDDDDDGNNDEDEAAKSKITPIKGEIICDAAAFLQYVHSSRSHALGDLEHGWTEDPMEYEDFFSSISDSSDVEKFAEMNDVVILPPRVLGYATREKLWGQFFVDFTEPPPKKETKQFEQHLQLQQEYKDLIWALVNSHEKGRTSQVEDIVSEKGKGLVLLLHGPPGVGKTLTAETIAQASGKPLFVISVAEIGLDASRAEKNLERLFALATKWEAILLIDEADVFLETRGTTADASRNALVSVLLRVLEYYKGVIILTTNRIKSIDVAVISRIHLAIRYEDLTADQMKKIFEYFLDQLEPHLIRDRKEIEKFIQMYGHHYELNGRQIRNIVAASLALAQQEKAKKLGDGKLASVHLSKVCEITKNFQDQLRQHHLMMRVANEAGLGKGMPGHYS
ncbi:hypothetical protein F5Y15DRAFT_418099 [Xylariaceae sp. FL0016]|nr:hypothetical protein F5Y15DRAFT_418099 [Xylariaceae sp. FL0016]